MTIDNAIELLKQEYEKATDSNYVQNPLAYALYQVWKKADRQILVEPKETDLTDKCGSCEWAMPIKGSTKGVFGCSVVCQNPNKVWRYDSSNRKQRTTLKCKHYKRKSEDSTCVSCGMAIPEGRQICHSCEVREND